MAKGEVRPNEGKTVINRASEVPRWSKHRSNGREGDPSFQSRGRSATIRPETRGHLGNVGYVYTYKLPAIEVLI